MTVEPIGAYDVSSPADAGRAYYPLITSAKSLTIVPNTPHTVEQTQVGVDAYVASVRAAMK